MAAEEDSAVAGLLGDGNMNITRIFKHLLHLPWLVHTKFSPQTLTKIEACIQKSESQHSAEIRFAVESSLGFFDLLQDISCFDWGVDVFSELRIWDTENNNGVLIFLLLADRKVEIIADRGFNDKIKKDEWTGICQIMEKSFGQHDFEMGVIEGINQITQILIKHYPVNKKGKADELSNKPVIM